jgi:spore coat polysaccharide biosynthesis protein SpsF
MTKELNTVAIIQARMTSTRLPGKVLLDLHGKPMLQRVVERARRASTVHQVMVATTVEPSDDPIVEFCGKNDIPVSRGSLSDVLDRYMQAARSAQADVVVRLTADCPLLDPQVVDDVVHAFLGPDGSQPYDFAANRLPPPWHRTFPIGLDTEVVSMQALERAWREARKPHQREHVMPYFYEQEGRFRVKVIDAPADYGWMRWTVDTPQDLELVRTIFERFAPREDFSWMEVAELFQNEPGLKEINAQVGAKDYRETEKRTHG